VEAFVQLLVRDVAFGVRLLQAPYGGVTVIVADRWVFR
jgi:hypothetical protein